ncbi:MAG TPA: CBS domain-containing protein [Candidatus Saccharimonadales bacterium]|nr:CBS domain-containing protein [Candidatus Saccharimonadales bacterium]
MYNFLLGLLLVLCAVVLWTLQQSYQHVPAHELKRLARTGDAVAQLLYRAGAYGTSLSVLLGGGALLLAALALVLLVSALGTLLGLLLALAVLAVGALVFVPGGELTRSSLWLAKRGAPALAWLLERLHPLIDVGVRFVRKHRRVHIHTGLYEKADLAALLEQQKDQPDSRIGIGEIDLLLHNLSFGDKLVADTLVPKRVLKLVAASDHIGPVLMDELARSGHSRFPVYDGKRDNIVGILYLHDLVGARQTGTVANVMSHKLTYVHENFTLYQTLQAFLKTKQHLFLVVDSFEELVGVITIEDVLEQMIGKPIVDEFDRYDDLRAVAAADARKEHKAHDEPKPEPGTTLELTEVVE